MFQQNTSQNGGCKMSYIFQRLKCSEKKTPNQPGHFFLHFGTKLILVCHFISSCVAVSSPPKGGEDTDTMFLKTGFCTKRHSSANV